MNKDDDVTLIPVAIASQAAAGNVATIPATQATAGDGRVSIDLGYPPECAISVAAGGKYPEMQDANGVYRLLSSAIRSNQSWGILPFDADFATGIGGYPAGAIVSGSTSGTFWISTADNNTTTPGASGAEWLSLFAGYITQVQSDARYLMLSSTALQTVTGPVTFGGTTLVPEVTDWTKRQALGAADAEGRYVRSPANPATDYRIQTISRNKASGGIFAFAEDGSNTQLQPAGDYATNTALQSEASSRASADANLQSSKANLVGGNQFSGDQFINGHLFSGLGSGWGGGTTAGSERWSLGGLAFGSPTGLTNAYTGYFQITDTMGSPGDNYSGINMFGFDYSGKRYDWFFPWNGNIITPKGAVAFQSDVANNYVGSPGLSNDWHVSQLQVQASSGKPWLKYSDQIVFLARQDDLPNMGNYVSQSQYQNDFATSDNRVINLPYGHRIQVFTATVSGSSQTVTFPTAFSSTNGMVVLATCSLQPGYTNRAGLVQVNSWTASSANVTTFFLDAPNLEFATAGLPCYFVAIGPK